MKQIIKMKCYQAVLAGVQCRLKSAFKPKDHGCRGVTLVEVLISTLIIMVLATGALSYQYYSTRDVKHSEVQATASRLGMLLLEGWKGVDGDKDYAPQTIYSSDMTIKTASIGPAVPVNRIGWSFRTLGKYEVLLDETYYYVTLSYDPSYSFVRPKILNATVAWQPGYQQATKGFLGDEPSVKFSTFTIGY